MELRRYPLLPPLAEPSWHAPSAVKRWCEIFYLERKSCHNMSANDGPGDTFAAESVRSLTTGKRVPSANTSYSHLDDAHQNLEETRQDEVKDWFKAQMDKAKRFQPLAVLNQKLKGLDVFESNENSQPVPVTSSRQPGSAPAVEYRPVDPDEVVTREHWQQRTPYSVCYEPNCGKRLTATNGCVNCRKCGQLFCEEHTMYQMKLSRSAQYEPVRGLWCRVCETCYKSRPGYNDHNGRQPCIDWLWLDIV